MLKRLLVLIILTPLLFNGVWASAHTTEDDHDSYKVPHLHFDTALHGLVEQQSPENNSAEEEQHEHFHIHLSVFLKSDDMKHFEARACESPVEFKSRLSSLTLTPPVPPPTV